MPRNEFIDLIIELTEPLSHARGNRLPLLLFPLTGSGTQDQDELKEILTDLDARGLALIAAWDHKRNEDTLSEGLAIARAQQALGLSVNVNANALLHHFCNGDPETAHIAADDDPFFDLSFSETVQMGCPFALKDRHDEIRARVETFCDAYNEAGVPLDFIFADWEIDGPIEWNGAWDASKRCMRCRERIPDIEDFAAFQRALREVRSEMQRDTFADPVLARYPDARVGNYAVYPHNGTRYWYDFFEEFVDGAPHARDGRARNRQWAHEFAATHYNIALSVVYTWYPTWSWYDYGNGDYRWFYNMLQVASNAGSSTPPEIPLVSFVHWHTTAPPPDPDPSVNQFSESAYQELLWHLLLRGHDGLFLWCMKTEIVKEVALLHTVYAASLEYGDFLEGGEPITFDVPSDEGAVVSGLLLDDRVLVRRTDFTDATGAASIEIGGKTISVPRVDGRCQILSLH